MKHQKSYILAALTSVSVLAMATTATAQDADDDEIIAVGIRQSLQNALIQKREAESLIEVIEAEDIGKLPDQNLAEVLENITGIQITRTAGVGTGVQIRGTNDNRVEINGVSGLGSGTGRGGIDFEDINSAIISSVEVTKAPEARTIEGSVGGTINLRTIRPLSLDDSLASLRIQGENSNLSDATSPRISGTIGKKWQGSGSQEIGVVLSASYTEQEATSFRPRVDRDNLANVAGDRFLGIQFLNQELENFEFENLNFAGSVEARANENIKLYFDAIVKDQTRNQDSFRIQGSGVSNFIDFTTPTSFETIDFGSRDGVDLGSVQAALTGTIQPIINPNDPLDNNGAFDSDDPNLRFSSDVGARETNSEIYRLGTELKKGNLKGTFEYSASLSNTVNPNLSTTLNFINPRIPLNGSSNDNPTPFIYDLSGGSLTFGIDFDSPLAPTVEELLDPANVLLDAVSVGADTTENREDAFRADVSYDLTDNSTLGGFLTSIDVGYRYNDISSEFNDIGSNFSTGSINSSPNGLLFQELLVAGPSNFGEADDRELAFRNFLLIDPNLAANDPDGTLAILQAALATTPNGNLNNPDISPSAFFNISEKTHAFYGQANFEFGLFRGNIGARWLDTSLDSTGNTIISGVTSQTVTSSGYDEFLPRVNLAANLTEDILLRASWSEDIFRPDFGDLNTSVNFPTGPNNAVNIGNPDLVPSSVTSFDVSADWYFAPRAVFSVGFFHKDRDGNFTDLVEEPFEDADGFRDITAPCEGGGIFNPVPDRNVLSPVIGNGLCVPIATRVNDTVATTQTGVEVAFQYDLSDWEDKIGFASGFGVLANYTWQDFSGGEIAQNASGRGQEVFDFTTGGVGQVSAVQGLLDNSENAFNVTGYYEKYGLSARLRYTWRDAFRTLDTAAGASLNSTLGFPVVTAARGQLNGSINYDVTEHFTVGVEGVNLTQSDIEQFCVNDGALLCFQGLPDRRITFGGTYTF